jgi:hypothetical protein
MSSPGDILYISTEVDHGPGENGSQGTQLETNPSGFTSLRLWKWIVLSLEYFAPFQLLRIKD